MKKSIKKSASLGAAAVIFATLGIGAAVAQTTAPAPMQSPAAPMTTGTVRATTEAPGPWLGSQVWKQGVYDAQENRIGEVDNIVIGADGKITDALIGVGGFLGMGEKTVAIPFANLKPVKRDGKMWFVTAMTKEQLNTAPAYDVTRYEVK